MSSTLSFVPRKVAKRVSPEKKCQNVVSAVNHVQVPTIHEAHGLQNHPSVEPQTAATASGSNSTQNEGKGKGKARAVEDRASRFTDIDYARLLCLALSDYSLWSDPELRRALDPTQTKDDSETGYVPLDNVLKRLLPHFGIVSPPSTALVGVVKALRACTGEWLDVRLMLEEPSIKSDGWQGPKSGNFTVGSKSLGGYEIGRKDWTRQNTPAGLSFSKQNWHERTVYVERIPTRYRSVPSAMHLIMDLLSQSGSSFDLLSRIQGVALPAHHQDKPGDPPKFKDFCLVTLVTIEDAEFLTKRWPWTRSTAASVESTDKDIVSEVVRDATKFGLRTLSKTNWEHLKGEYLRYRSQLIEKINEHEDAQVETQTRTIGKRERDVESELQRTPSAHEAAQTPSKADALSPDAPYPYGCLILVRNIHPETNKTTLRALFSVSKGGGLKEDGLDYIDFNKGVDSCYLRLSTPTHTDALVSHFVGESLVQAHGLDDNGLCTGAGSGAKPIVLEKVLGRREEVYWERVPEKVRRQAVQRVIAAAEGDQRPGNAHRADQQLKKKRRK
ncbi:hypothetical protein APHAL10511_001515 [Amanita phalloides]|nr:hypothetical protein APHAL10511_001515 [Amanita phalloides]